MDQRNSLKTKSPINFDTLKWNSFNKKDKKDLGRKIKLQSKTFNKKFIDNIDIENYKSFVDTIYKIGHKLINYKLAKKLFNDYKIIDLYFDNIRMIEKEYLDYLYLKVIKTLFDIRDFEMQTHRDIIDICKLGYEKTGYIECYYYLAHIIYHMCWCCYRPTNAWKTALKYYELCLSNGYENYSIYEDLIEIYCNYIFNTNKNTIQLEIEVEKKEEYFDQFLVYWYKFNEKYKENTYQLNEFAYSNLFDNFFKLLVQMKKKSLLDAILFDEDIQKIEKINTEYLADCLYYYHDNHLDDFTSINDKLEKEMDPVNFICLKIKLYVKQNNQTQLISSVEEALNLYFQSIHITKLNKVFFVSISDSIYSFFEYYNENIIVISDDLCIKLINFYYLNLQTYSHNKWIRIFVIFFNNICINRAYDDYLNDKLNVLCENNELNDGLTNGFKKYDMLEAKKFIDGIDSITTYLINKKNKESLTALTNFLGKICLFCDNDGDNEVNIKNKYSNPFKTITSISEPLNESDKNKFGWSKKLNIESIGARGSTRNQKFPEAFKGNTWCFIKGEDPDYDPMYSTYSDYYNALYGIKDQIEINQKIESTNEYIQEKINLVKEKIDSFANN
jgi:hypothetical protein